MEEQRSTNERGTQTTAATPEKPIKKKQTVLRMFKVMTRSETQTETEDISTELEPDIPNPQDAEEVFDQSKSTEQLTEQQRTPERRQVNDHSKSTGIFEKFLEHKNHKYS